MQITRWQKGESEVRYYVNLHFGCKYMNYSECRLFDGVYLYKGQNGLLYAKNKARLNDGSLCGAEFINWLFHVKNADPFAFKITWERWEDLFNASLTKSGNFSLTRFWKNLGI